MTREEERNRNALRRKERRTRAACRLCRTDTRRGGEGRGWIRVDDGSSMRCAGRRRRVWRAARRASEQARDRDGVGEVQCQAGEVDGEQWEKEVDRKTDKTLQ